ncbi:MAG: cell division inhibitor SepF [Clostridia bacterium]|nr:cell division protein SepF [Clostridiales bacterium]MDK2986383.1 cell division inhibitor SepF [Clostridia bacterium]
MGEWWKGIAKILGYEVEEVADDKLNQRLENEDAFFQNSKSKRNNVVSLHTAKNSKLVLLKPNNFDKVQEIADYLKNNTAVVVNLDEVDKDLAIRILDFLSGTIYAIKGKMQKVSSNIFLLTPSNYQVLDPGHKDKLKFPEKIWDKNSSSLKGENNV